MILSSLTAIFTAISAYLGFSLFMSNVDVFYIYIVTMVLMTTFVKVAHHSSETKVRIDTKGGAFIASSISLLLLLLIQEISNQLLFKGI